MALLFELQIYIERESLESKKKTLAQDDYKQAEKCGGAEEDLIEFIEGKQSGRLRLGPPAKHAIEHDISTCRVAPQQAARKPKSTFSSPKTPRKGMPFATDYKLYKSCSLQSNEHQREVCITFFGGWIPNLKTKVRV
jgi:hypothetical protein